ncbi:NAD-dependent epimerase/dehydratase family protein [Flindersiella endophytica]
MRVVVTGGFGFVGHAVTRNLVAAGHDVAVLTHSGKSRPRPDDVTVLEISDIRDRTGMRDALVSFRPDSVCHLAALAQVRTSFEQPLEYFDVNVGGTISLLDGLSSLNKPTTVVFGSTGSVYGSGAEGKLSEDDPARPDTPYAATKYAAEQLLTYQAQTGAIGTTILRAFAIAGACDGIGDPDDTRILPKALRVAAGQALHVAINGDGSAVREFTHVLDVAEAYRLALEATKPGESRLYNVGSGTGITMADLIKTVTERTGRDVPVQHQPPKPEPHTLIADSIRIRTDLGWTSPNSTVPQIIGDSWAALEP